MSSELSEEEKNVSIWKMKKLIKNLSMMKGNGTSMISLIIRQGDAISASSKLLTEEQGTATNIKSRVNRLSVLSAITSTSNRLRLYNRTPPNGLIIYCGTILTDDGKERQVTFDFEPFKPINSSLYMCDNKFHTEALLDLLNDEKTFGFIVVNGDGALYATICGNARNILQKITVDLPKKHRKGGQSSVRFARLRVEKRHNYLRRVAELATINFITNDKPNVSGLILAGSADFKEQLNRSDMFDPRLQTIVMSVIDISYGGEEGLNQAIELSAEILSEVKFIKEKKLLCEFFEEISIDSGKYCYGVSDTFAALEMGAVRILIIWENLEMNRYVLFDSSQGVEIIKYLTSSEEQKSENFRNEDANIDLEVRSKENLIDWLADNYKKFGCQLEIVTNKSPEGSQYCKGFGGIGGLLRWKVDFNEINVGEESALDNDMDDFI